MTSTLPLRPASLILFRLEVKPRSLPSLATLFAILVVLCLNACRRTDSHQAAQPPNVQSAAPPQLTGQVFVALDNRETLKLSATEICVINLGTAQRLLSEVDARRKPTVNHAYLQLMLDKEGLQGSKGIAEAQREDDPIKLMMRQANPLSKGATGSRDEAVRLEGAIAADSAAFQKLCRLATYTNDVQADCVRKTTTDTEGRFFMVAPTADEVLFARAVRKAEANRIELMSSIAQMSDEQVSHKLAEEHYCWMVRVPAGTTYVLLSNTNMLDTDDEANVARDFHRNRPKEPQ